MESNNKKKEIRYVELSATYNLNTDAHLGVVEQRTQAPNIQAIDGMITLKELEAQL